MNHETISRGQNDRGQNDTGHGKIVYIKRFPGGKMIEGKMIWGQNESRGQNDRGHG